MSQTDKKDRWDGTYELSCERTALVHHLLCLTAKFPATVVSVALRPGKDSLDTTFAVNSGDVLCAAAFAYAGNAPRDTDSQAGVPQSTTMKIIWHKCDFLGSECAS